jgi:hypothetical protein
MAVLLLTACDGGGKAGSAKAAKRNPTVPASLAAARKPRCHWADVLVAEAFGVFKSCHSDRKSSVLSEHMGNGFGVHPLGETRDW